MLGTAEEVRTNSLVMFLYELLHRDTPVFADQQKNCFLKFCLESRCRLEDWR